MNISYSHFIYRSLQPFWFSTPGGFTGSQRDSSNINNKYVDVISLTYETSSRTYTVYGYLLHIGSFNPGKTMVL